jgi:hypothetical protein
VGASQDRKGDAVSYILDTGCPTCDGPVEMNLEWACTGDDRCADPNHELTLVYRCWNDHQWTSDPEDFPDDAVGAVA